MSGANRTNRAEVEDLLYREAELLDSWRLDEWLAMLAPDARYEVPPNDRPEGDHRDTLFLVADDMARIKARVKRLQSTEAHAEYPRSRTRRMIHNVQVSDAEDGSVNVCANFVVYRFRRNAKDREYVGHYRYRLTRDEAGALKIAYRRAILDSDELGPLGSVSFIL